MLLFRLWPFCASQMRSRRNKRCMLGICSAGLWTFFLLRELFAAVRLHCSVDLWLKHWSHWSQKSLSPSRMLFEAVWIIEAKHLFQCFFFLSTGTKITRKRKLTFNTPKLCVLLGKAKAVPSLPLRSSCSVHFHLTAVPVDPSITSFFSFQVNSSVMWLKFWEILLIKIMVIKNMLLWTALNQRLWLVSTWGVQKRWSCFTYSWGAP